MTDLMFELRLRGFRRVEADDKKLKAKSPDAKPDKK